MQAAPLSPAISCGFCPGSERSTPVQKSGHRPNWTLKDWTGLSSSCAMQPTGLVIFLDHGDAMGKLDQRAFQRALWKGKSQLFLICTKPGLLESTSKLGPREVYL